MSESQNMSFSKFKEKCRKCFKGAKKCILCIIHVRSLFCSVRVYISMYFMFVLLVKLGFHVSVF